MNLPMKKSERLLTYDIWTTIKSYHGPLPPRGAPRSVNVSSKEKQQLESSSNFARVLCCTAKLTVHYPGSLQILIR